ncbi:MAG: Gfo/Idh/MocA family oxidoreductase [bacterium]
MSNIKAAVIGIHGIGRLHGKTMIDTGKIDLVAVCDVNPDMKKVAEEEFSGTKFYESIDDMLKNENLDVVIVVTPHNLHGPIAIKVLEAGINVVTEKPMTTNYEDALKVIETAKKAGKFATVFHNRRLDAWYLAAKSTIVDGLLGDIIELNIGINLYSSPKSWRGFKETGGGVAFDWGVHLIDYAVMLSGSKVNAVSGFIYNQTGKDPVLNEDHATVRIYFENGSIANCTVSGVSKVNPERFKIIGTKGTLIDMWQWEDGIAKVYTNLSTGEEVITEIKYGKTHWSKFYDNLINHILYNEELLVSAESAAQNINILKTAEKSSAQGGIPLPLC